MIDLDVLERRGCSAEKVRAVFEKYQDDLAPAPVGDSEKSVHTKIADLRNRVRNRIMAGRDWNFANYKTFHALDIAWNTPFKQISPTLLASLMGGKSDDAAITQKLESWGFDLSRVIEGGTMDPATKRITGGKVNVPAFFQVFVPLVRAYVTIRWAKIVNDRRLIPFFKYEPAITTKKNRVRCEVLTNRIELMARQMGYFEVMKQSVFQMLHYGFCLKFPKEQWWTESQETENDTATATEESDHVPTPDLEATAESSEDSEVKSVIVKEGIRYHMPHPARVFWDQAHRISTFNSDTGCEYAGYWHVVRYRDIAKNQNFWCTDKVGFGNTDWWNSTVGIGSYWNTVFRGCTMSWPQATTKPEGNNDRESKLAYNLYNQAEFGDTSCTLTEYFEKLIPSEWGLGDYTHPVWFRFVVAGDSATIIYAAPMAYCPIIAYIYDADENRDINASLSLEILPFQDQFSNLLTQYLLTVQHNLTNATFIDKDQVDEEDIKKIENAGEHLWRSRTFVRYSQKRNLRAQNATPNAVFSAQFQQLDSQSIVQAMKVLLDTLERVLVMSSMEVAQAASHEQTRAEVNNIASQQSTRLVFTQTPVDLATEAWKRQLYAGEMAYGSAEFFSYVAYDRTITSGLLKELGFTTVESDEEGTPNRRAYVKGDKKNLREKRDSNTAIMLEAFSATRDGNDRVSDSEGAAGLMQLLMSSVNTEYGVSIGGEQFIDIINQIGQRTGLFDRDYKLVCKFDPTEVMKKRMEMEAKGGGKGQAQGGEQQVAQQIMPMMQMLQQQIMKDIGEAIKPLGETVTKTVEGLRALSEIIDKQIMPALKQSIAVGQQNSQDIQAIAGAIKSIEEHVAPEPGAAPALTPEPAMA